MSGSDYQTESDSDLPTEIDTQRLSALLEQAISLRDSGDASFVATVLNQLDETERERYREPLLERLQQFASRSSGAGDGIATIEVGFSTPQPNEPLPTVDARTTKRRSSKPRDRKSKSLPERIGKFVIKSELGRGACGAVYLAYDEELQRNVAVKVSHVTGKQQQEQLRIEATKLAQIESPGIIPVYHTGKTEFGDVFIVEKYIEGSTLRDLIKPGPLSPAMTVALTREIALGLEPAHVREIVHRDLKPENILIEKSNGRPWIADFGLAISEEEQRGHQRQLAGTPPYMAPEQIKGRVDVLEPRSDIWALGVMYYEMLTGKLPFNGADRQSLSDQICNLDPRPLQQRAPGLLTEAMNEVFLRCCAKKVADRYPSVRDLANDLTTLMAGNLSDRNIQGDTMTERIGEMVTETARSTYLSTQRFSTTSVSGQMDSQGVTSKRWLSVFALWVIGAVVVIGVSIAGSVAAIVHLRTDAEPLVTVAATGPAAESDSAPQGDPENLMGPDQADGSLLKPFVVATDGQGSHRTIAAAIDEGRPDAHVRVMPGVYEEALRITVPITIFGPRPQITAGVRSYEVELRSDRQTPLTVDCPDGKVTFRNFMIEGEGHHSKEEFNAIDLLGGELVLDSCELTTHSFNCVKVHKGSTLEASTCRFDKSHEFAISAVDATVNATGCTFVSSGVQLVGGTGLIEDCKLYGAYGVYASRSSESVKVVNCLLDKNLQWGISSTNGGDIWASGVTILGCKYGIRASVLNQENEDHPPGRVILTGGSTLNKCDTGVFLQGGIFQCDEGCTIEESDFGIWAEQGTVTARDLVISQMGSNGISALDEAVVKLEGCMIDRCKATGIDLFKKGVVELNDCTIEGCQTGIQVLAGKLNFNGGVIRDCSTVGILLGDKENWSRGTARGTIEDVAISGVGTAGIIAYAGPMTLSETTFNGGDVGLWAWGPPSSELGRVPLVEISLVGTRFTNQTRFTVVAQGDARITVDQDSYDAVIRSQKVMPPAKIVVAGPAGNSDRKPNSKSRSDRP